MRTSLFPKAAVVLAFFASALNVAARDGANAESMQRSFQPTASTDCLSLDRYNEAADTAMKNTDWAQIPGSEKLLHGTKSSMTEFLVFKEAQKEGLPPCPDLSSTHKEFAKPADAVSTLHQSDALKKPDTMKARRSATPARPKATVTGNAWVRK